MLSDPIVSQLFGTSPTDPKKKKKPAPKVTTSYENFVDPWKDLGKGFKDNVKSNAKDAVSDAWKQLLGGDKLFHGKSQGGDLQPGQELDLKAQQAQQEEAQKMEKKANNIRPAMDYIGDILKVGETPQGKDTQQTQQEIQNLIVELKSLAASTKELEKEIMEATGSTIVSPGAYHKNFFRHVLSIVRDAKAKIDSAGSWLAAMKGKQKKGMGMGKQKKSNDYWDKAKEHGTKFTLSGERSVSNQTG